MELAYAEQYRKLAREHWWSRARRARILPVIAHYAAKGSAILDVGCAGGVLFPYLDAIGETWGIEPDATLVGEGNEYRDRIHTGFLDETYRAPRQFGIVLFLDVLEHLDDPVATLRQAATIMEPGGVIIATVPAFQWLWSSHDELNLHRKRYTRTTIAEVGTAAGFRVADSSYFFHWTVPIMWARAALERLRHVTPSPPVLLPKPFNDAITWLSLLEFRFLTRFKVPFGSSILVVLRRQ